jgi:hypothetical protein
LLQVVIGYAYKHLAVCGTEVLGLAKRAMAVLAPIIFIDAKVEGGDEFLHEELKIKN